METLVVSEVNCDNCFEKYTRKTGRKFKGRTKEHKDTGIESRKDEKITGL